ncbi:MAG: hypothetical protein QOF01_3488 [Thermomicrobiales bacterium]|jgi:hypothetical protein|nr:hypothetical protein [Thermomicrobiales bacterium]
MRPHWSDAMTYVAIGKALFCLFLGVALLASVVAFVPGPLQVLAALVVLPIESLLLAFATSPRRSVANRAAVHVR